MRRVLGIPFNTHCRLLSLLCNELSIESQLHIRFLKFFHQSLNSENECLQICSQMALRGSRSKTCNSINFICTKYWFPKQNLAYRDIHDIVDKVCQVSDETHAQDDLITASVISEMLSARDNKHFEVLSLDQINIIIYLCTS